MTIDDIRRANAHAGKFFFSPGALRFFASRIGRAVHEGPGGIYFITSEQFETSNGWRDARRYTVRQFCPVTGEVDTVGPFNVQTRAQAARLARQLALKAAS
jgi:hypothetical protein